MTFSPDDPFAAEDARKFLDTESPEEWWEDALFGEHDPLHRYADTNGWQTHLLSTTEEII